MGEFAEVTDAASIARQPWDFTGSESRFIATAIHDGHDVRSDAIKFIKLSEKERLREEDPFTAELASIAPVHIVVHRSRFEVDMNRPREKAVYLKPEDAWGLDVWEENVPDEVIEKSLKEYDDFYSGAKSLLDRMTDKFGGILIYDLHTYNHRRQGPDAAPEDPEANPEINVGTGPIDSDRWGRVVEAFMTSMRETEYCGRQLDVRENVKFDGGHFSHWIAENYPDACVLAIEFKKIFMDEWTGKVDRVKLSELKSTLASTIEPTLQAFDDVIGEAKSAS